MPNAPTAHATMPQFDQEAGRYVADGYPVEAGFYWVGYFGPFGPSEGERPTDVPYLGHTREVFSPPYASWRPAADGSWGAYTDTSGPWPTKKDAEEAARRPHGDLELKLRLSRLNTRSMYVLTDWPGHSFEGSLRLVSKRSSSYVGGRYVGPYSVYYWSLKLNGRTYSGRNCGLNMALRMRAPVERATE